MPVTADLEWDASGFRDQLGALIDDWPATREAVLRALGEDLAGNLRREIPTSSGAAEQTIRTVDTGGEGSSKVVAGGMRGVDYIVPLLEGSQPHPPGPSDPAANPRLARWASRNGYPGGFHSIYWSIARYGTEPHDFVSAPVEQTQTEADTIAAAVLQRRGVFE